MFFVLICRNVLLGFIALTEVNYQNLVILVSIATALDKQNVLSAQKVSVVRILHQNPLHVLRGSTVLRETQLVQYALGVTSVQMVHLQRFVQLDNLHPLALRLVRHVLLVIDALGRECLHQKAAQMDSTQTKHYRQGVTLVKLVGSVQMATVLCHVQRVISVNTDSPTVRHANQGNIALLGQQTVSHVLQESSV